MASQVKEEEPLILLPEQVAVTSLGDRRRPGRINGVSPSLIQLLREPEVLEGHQHDSDDHDGNDPTKGIAVGILISLPFWVLIISGMLLAF